MSSWDPLAYSAIVSLLSILTVIPSLGHEKCSEGAVRLGATPLGRLPDLTKPSEKLHFVLLYCPEELFSLIKL